MSVCPPGKCVAATDAKCLAPLREDFVGILGNLQNLLD